MEQASTMGAGVAFAALIVMFVAAVFAVRVGAAWLRERGMSRWLAFVVALVAAPLAMFGGALVVFGVTSWGGEPLAVSSSMTIAGVLCLVPFLWLWRRQRPSRLDLPGTRGKSQTTKPSRRERREEKARQAKLAADIGMLRRMRRGAEAAPLQADDEDDELPDDRQAYPVGAAYRFRYRTADGEVGEREAFIYQIQSYGGRDYFESRRLDSNAHRSYRADRVIGKMICLDTGEIVRVRDVVRLAKSG